MTDDRPASARYPEAVATFMGNGWTVEQWDNLYEFFDVDDDDCDGPGNPDVANWLCHPPEQFVTPITPAMVRDLHDRYDECAVDVGVADILNVIASGASERFCAAYLTAWRPLDDAHVDVNGGWQYARDLGLAEPQAVGWAATDYLGNLDYLDPITTDPATGEFTAPLGSGTPLIHTWVDRFGPNSWLHVLAGIDLDEATAMRDAGTSPTEKQLRVMAALAGHTLPAGV